MTLDTAAMRLRQKKREVFEDCVDMSVVERLKQLKLRKLNHSQLMEKTRHFPRICLESPMGNMARHSQKLITDPTVASSVKGRTLNPPMGSEAFLPVNPSQAKSTVQPPMRYDLNAFTKRPKPLPGAYGLFRPTLSRPEQ